MANANGSAGDSQLAALISQGWEQLQARNYAQAMKLFREAIAFDPDADDAHDGLATCGYMTQDFPTAIEHFTRLSQLRPTEGAALFNLGAIHNRLQEYQKALECIRKGIQRDKRCAEGFYNLGIAHRKLNQSSLAISAYKEAIRLEPSFAEAYQNLGNVYSDMGNFPLAIMNYKKALEIRPDFEKAKAGLQRAESAVAQQKKSVNPFGRLVTESVQTTKPAPLIERELSERERYEDRRAVHVLAIEIEVLAKQAAEQLKTELVPALHSVSKAVAQGGNANLSLSRAVSELDAAAEKYHAQRRLIRRKVLELRAHEELLLAPDVNL